MIIVSFFTSYLMHISCSLQGLSSLSDKGEVRDSTEYICFSYTEILLLLHSLSDKKIRQYFSKSEKSVNYEVPETYEGQVKKNSELFR